MAHQKPSWQDNLWAWPSRNFTIKPGNFVDLEKNWIAASLSLLATRVLRQSAEQIRVILIIATLFLLSSCGFKPIYKTTNNKTYELLQKIELARPSTIEGAEFYNQLKNMIPPSLPAEYILETKLNFSQDFSIIEKNSDVLREVIALKVSYLLKEKVTDRIITSGRFTRLSSYNTSFSTYTNLTQNQQSILHLATISAEEVRNRIILYIENSQKSARQNYQ